MATFQENIVYANLSEESKLLHIGLAGMTYPDKNYKIKRTNSEVYVFEYVLDGEGCIECDGDVFHVEKGDFYFLRKGSSHCYYADKKQPYIKIWFNATGELIDELTDLYGITQNVLVCPASVGELFYDINSLLVSNRSNTEKIGELSLKIHQLLIQVSHGTVSVVKSNTPNENELTGSIKNYLDGKVYSKVLLKDLCDEFFMGKVQIIRIFKKQYDITPYSYLLGKKIQVAQNLLQHTGLNVKEIAIKLAFEDEHYFSNIFKKRTGLSPAIYRKTKRIE